jgi:hypothetical protein
VCFTVLSVFPRKHLLHCSFKCLCWLFDFSVSFSLKTGTMAVYAQHFVLELGTLMNEGTRKCRDASLGTYKQTESRIWQITKKLITGMPDEQCNSLIKSRVLVLKLSHAAKCSCSNTDCLAPPLEFFFQWVFGKTGGNCISNQFLEYHGY